jgi:Ser/Thr protein kinase RdoA (MazF antagonist)
MREYVLDIGSNFRLDGELISVETFEAGHINDTYVLSFLNDGSLASYTLQRINHEIFKDPPAVIENIRRVTEHLHHKNGEVTSAKKRQAFSLISTHDGEFFHLDEDGNYWRVYHYIDNAKSYNVVHKPEHAFQAAKAFGRFQRQLLDFSGPRLNETIKDFHDTPKRYKALEEAINADAFDRVKMAGREIEFAMRYQQEAGKLIELHKQGFIPERITHNDTKFNNVLIDDCTGDGICVIDLDTVMPGLTLYDFGDMVRSSTSPAAEDETDLDKVFMRMSVFEALVKGYLLETSDFLTQEEIDNLTFSGKLISLEIGVRFLTDFLQGDVYFKTRRAPHNLERCRTQFKLVQSIEEQEKEMNDLVKQL